MARRRNHYQILGLETHVSADEIKRAYRELVKMQHPDTKHHTNGGSEAQQESNEAMMQLNEAYSTLMDVAKRADYDYKIGMGKKIPKLKRIFSAADEDAQREKFLRSAYHPTRAAISKVLAMYEQQIHQLSLDPFDDQLIEAFQGYADQIELALRNGAEALSPGKTPSSLEAAVHMMRYAIAQAADGLEEMRQFCKNYNHSHLTMAENLFRIAADLSRQSSGLTKC